MSLTFQKHSLKENNMNIHFNSPDIAPLIQRNFLSSLTRRQTRIIAIATIAFSCLTVCYFILKRYTIKATSKQRSLNQNLKFHIQVSRNQLQNKDLPNIQPHSPLQQPSIEFISLNYAQDKRLTTKREISEQTILDETYSSPTDAKAALSFIEGITSEQIQQISKILINNVLDRLQVDDKQLLEIPKMHSEGEIEVMTTLNARSEFEKHAILIFKNYLKLAFKYPQRFLNFGYVYFIAKDKGIIQNTIELTGLPFDRMGALPDELQFTLRLNKSMTQRLDRLVFNLTEKNLKNEVIQMHSFTLS